MKRFLATVLTAAIVLGSFACCFAAPAKTAPEYIYDTSTLSWREDIIPGDLSVRATIPNYLGTLEGVTLETSQGTAQTDVTVVYVPDSKWDGSSYYSALELSISKEPMVRLFSGSTPIIGWKDLYTYGFLPVDGGSVVFSGKTVLMHLLQGPGLYSAYAAVPFTLEDLGIDMYEEAAATCPEYINYFGCGKEFMLVLNDTSIAHFLEKGTLEDVARFDWPGLKKLITASREEVAPPAEDAGLKNFVARNRYFKGIFIDVPLTKEFWFDSAVRSAYELGFMVGNGSYFYPNNSITLAECIKMAACMHNIYYGGDGTFTNGPIWYSVYVNYAVNNNIINATDFMAEDGSINYNRKATRAEMAYIFSSAVPDAALTQVFDKTYDDIPDVDADTEYGAAVIKFYRAGIVAGYEDGSYAPENNISRAEAAAIISRIADKSLRIEK